MSLTATLTIKKDETGFRVTRPRPSLLGSGLYIYIRPQDAVLWRASLAKVLQRLGQGRYRVLRLTLALRCMTGCWRRAIRDVCYLGRVRRGKYHIISVAGALYLLSIAADPCAIPISKDELESMQSRLTAT